jgi:cytochrome c-type biogenesis protein CcmF
VAGGALGFPAWVEPSELYDTWVGKILSTIYGIMPLFSSTLCAFVIGTVLQEFARGIAVRRKNKGESLPIAFYELVSRARRRYGGYTVHVGIVLMFAGFTGAAYDVEQEASLIPGESMEVGGYEFRYDSVRMEEDAAKRMVFTDITILRNGEEIAEVSPAKFIYRSHPEMPTTEVAIRTSILHNLYVIMSSVDPETRRGTFRIVRQPLVVWIWIGGLFLMLGVSIAVSPRLQDILGEAKARAPSRAGATAAILLLFLGGGAMWALAPPSHASAQSDSSSSLHAGTVIIQDPEERRLFGRLLCECGDCQRLPLDSCGCSWAEGMRAELRARRDRGEEVNDIIESYRDRFGAQAIAVPSDEGLDRALWAVPVAAIVLAAIGLVFRGRRWAQRGAAQTTEALRERTSDEEELPEASEDRLEDELRALDED